MALDVATAIEQGFREIYTDAEYVKMPVADGGEGTVEAMVAATQGCRIAVTVTGPLGEPVEAFYGLSGDRQCAFIEMAAASGLESVPPAAAKSFADHFMGDRRADSPCAGCRSESNYYRHRRQRDERRRRRDGTRRWGRNC